MDSIQRGLEAMDDSVSSCKLEFVAMHGSSVYENTGFKAMDGFVFEHIGFEAMDGSSAYEEM
jgi:hypothetical protein